MIEVQVRDAREARRHASRENKSRRVLDAALRLFAERGYYETSVDDVVAEARTSKTTFYEFFVSKEDCFRELIRIQGGALMHAVIEEAATGRDHRERLRRGIRTFVRCCASQRELARVMLVESVGISPTVEEVRHSLLGRFARLVEDEVRSAQDGSERDPFYATLDCVVFGRALVGAVNEATGHFLGQPRTDADKLANGLCQIFAPVAPR